METVGDRIKRRRGDLGWTQEELANKAGLSKGFLSDVENSKRKISAQNLLDLATVLSLSLDYLMKGEDSGDLRTDDIIMPAALAELAENEGLPFSKALTLLRMQRQIVAHRSRRGEGDGAFDWAQFYERLKGFLDG